MTSSPLVLGIDASTTGCKVLAFELDGRVAAEGRHAYPLDNPAVDAYEQDAEAWWAALVSAVRQVTEKLGARADAIEALCVTHQRETFVVTDDAGRPLHPAIVWMDRRGGDRVRDAVDKVGREALLEITGKPPSLTPSVYKWAALRGRKPALKDARLMDVHGFLAWRLTGSWTTSLASADPTGMVDMRRGDWSDDVLVWAKLSRSQVPALVPPGEPLGRLKPDVAKQCGLPSKALLFAGAGDGQAAGLGAGIDGPGRAYLNLGTALVSGVLSPAYQTSTAFRTLYAATPARFFFETDLLGGMLTLTWLQELVLATGDRAQLETAAAGLGPGADGLVLLPYLAGVMNPYWDDAASGAILGLRPHHRAEHFYRAALEGLALEQRLHLRGVEAESGPIGEVVVLGGGSKSSLFCQILVDVLGVPLVRAGTAEATALGAAIIAAVGSGLFPDHGSAAARMTTLAERFSASVDQRRYDSLFMDVYEPLYPSLKATMARLAGRRGDSAAG